MTRRVATGSLLLALGLAACSGAPDGATNDTTAALLGQEITDGVSTIVPGAPSAEDDAPLVPIAPLGFNRGDSSAIVKVLEMSDFGCTYCRRFHDETFPTLRSEFIETGMVEWKFVPYITGMFANSLAVTEAGECVMEQGREPYEAITGRLWEEQTVWKGSDTPEAVVRGWVGELGIDMGRYDSCLSEDRRIQRIAGATTLARQLGVRGTPTFVVLGYPPLQGALPTELFQDILSSVHAEEQRKRAEGAGAGAGN
jgi:protein-disulfide isomerase